jgi:WD40 repeat protein
MPRCGALLVLVACLSALALRPARSEPSAAQGEAGAQGKQAPRPDCHGDPLPAGALARLGTVRFRHPAGLSALAFSRDGKVIATGGRETVRLCDARTGKPLRRFPVYHNAEELRNSSTAYPSVEALHVLADGRLVALEEHGGSTLLYEAATGKKLWQVPDMQMLLGALSPDGKTAAVIHSEALGMTLLDGATGRRLRRVGGKKGFTTAIGFSPDGKALASGYADQSGNHLHLWDAGTGKELRRFPVERLSAYAIAFSPGGERLAVGYGTEIGDVLRARGAARGRDNALALLDAATGKELRLLHKGPGLGGRLAFSPDGKVLAVGSGGGVIHLLDLATGKERERPPGHEAPAVAVAFSADGKALISAGYDGSIRCWEGATGNPLRDRAGPRPGAFSLILSPDGKKAALLADDGFLRLLDIVTGEEVSNFRTQERVRRVAFSPDGNLLAAWAYGPAGEDVGTLRVLDTATGKELTRWRVKLPYCIAFSPHRRALALGGFEHIRFCELATGKEIWRCETQSHINFLRFSPDGKVLASSHSDQTYRLWEVATGASLGWKVTGPAREPTHHLSCRIAFSPDGKALASAGPDYTVRLWDVATARELRRFTGHEDSVNALAFSPNGKTLASASDDTTVLLWDVARVTAGRPAGAAPSADEFDALWVDLAGADAAKAHRAVWRLAGAPREAVPFLGKRLRPVVPLPPEEIQRLIGALDGPTFATRKRATQQLEDLGELAGPALRAALKGRPSAELRRQAERLLKNLEGPLPPSELRAVRAVQALEQSGAPEARQLLERLARGAPEDRLTREAKAAVARLAHKQPGT